MGDGKKNPGESTKPAEKHEAWKPGSEHKLGGNGLWSKIQDLHSDKHKQELEKELGDKYHGKELSQKIDAKIKSEERESLSSLNKELHKKGALPGGVDVVGLQSGEDGKVNKLVLADKTTTDGIKKLYIVDLNGKVERAINGDGAGKEQQQFASSGEKGAAAASDKQHFGVVSKDSAGRPTEVRNAKGTCKCEYDSSGNLTSVEWKDKSNHAHSLTKQADGTWNEDGKPNQRNIKDIQVEKSGDLVTSYKQRQSHVDKADGSTVDYAPGKKAVTLPDGTEKVWYANGTGYQRKPDGHGGYSEQHTGKRPDDTFVLKKSADGHVEISEKSGEKSYKPIDDPKVAAERQKLEAIATKKITDPQELAKFHADMARFEARTKAMEEQYKKQGDNPETAEKKAHEQAAKTYEQISRLLEAKDNPNLPITEKQRTELAEQAMRQAGTPTVIDQGNHGTCNVATIEMRAYTRTPAEAVKLLVDVATTGSYTKDGVTVNFDRNKVSLTPDENASKHPPIDGERGFASQIFQVTAVNLGKAMNNPNQQYEQVRPNPADTPPDAGERLKDYTNCPPSTPKEVLDSDKSPVRGPDMDCDEILKVNNLITGEKGNYSVIKWGKTETGADGVNSEEELRHKLADAKANGHLPIIIQVHSGNEPFYTDSGAGTAGGSGGWHVVNVTDYNPGPPPKVSIDNQWGTSSDHSGDHQITVGQLYLTMRDPSDANQIQDLQNQVLKNRKEGKIDDAKELELLRLKHEVKWINDQDYETQLKHHIQEISAHNQSGKLTDASMSEAWTKLESIVGQLPAHTQLEMVKYEHTVGLTDSKNYDNQLAGQFLGIWDKKRTAEKEGTFDSNAAEEYDKAVAEFNKLLRELPEDRRAAITKQVEELKAKTVGKQATGEG
jgi:YD repeat-containing protein